MPPDAHKAALLLAAHRGRLRALAEGLLQDRAGAEDVMQEAWLVATGHPPARNENVLGWLHVVVRRLSLRRLRSEARRRQREQVVARSERQPSSRDQLDRLEQERRLIDAIAALAEPHREVIVLRYFEGFAPREIAKRLDAPVATVKSRLVRALTKLREALDREHGGHRSWVPFLAGLVGTPPRGPAGNVGLVRLGSLAMAKKLAVLAGVVLLAAWVGWSVFVPAPSDAPVSVEVHEHSAGLSVGLQGAATEEGAASTAPEDADASRLLAGDAVPATSFAGRVVDRDGRGVAGARVGEIYLGPVVAADEPRGGVNLLIRRAREAHEEPTCRSDAGGFFRVDRPWRAVGFLRVSAPGFLPTITQAVSSGGYYVVTLAAQDVEPPSLRVRVEDPDGQPVEGAHVGLGGPQASAHTTDESGLTVFEDLPPGDYTVGTVFGRQYVRAPAKPGDSVVLRKPAGPARLELRVTGLPTDVTPAYSLLTRTGGAVPDATGFIDMDDHVVTTPGFTPGQGVVVVRAPGYAWALARFESFELQTTTVEIALAPAGRVSGHVEGEPMAGEFLLLRRQNPPELPSDLAYALARSLGSAHVDARPGEDHTFVAEDVAPGRYVATCGRYKGDPVYEERARSEPFDVVSGQSVEVVLRP
ncbi:MAG: sigma-70 family RNA polymerase sigma factor [Planctomycetota bacterium]